ncbi:MAG: DUF6691 family protein [Pseudoruegeria sp.]
MRKLVSLLAGSIFGIGLLISGMVDTAKVQGWLDLFGDWDPTLAFVMGGAILPMAIAWRMTEGRTPRFGTAFPEKPDPRLGRNIVIGSVLFGMGWGLSGLCPGPAMASLSFNGLSGLTFFAAMVLGMWITPTLKSRLDATDAA